MAEHLQALESGSLPDGKRRLCINIPPRMLKSLISSICFPAWLMGRNPSTKIITTSYKFELAREMAQKSRILMESPEYQEIFPNTKIDSTQNEKHNFWTTERGMYYSSATLSVTGRGADIVILDDPINPTEAASETIRNSTNEVIASTIPSRFNDLRAGKWLMVMQRLHEDDPTGRFVLNDDRWYMLKLPAVNRSQKTISYALNGKSWSLEPGKLLFPQRLTAQVLEDQQKDMGEYHFAGQYLQEPIPTGGGEFKDNWIHKYPNGGLNYRNMNFVILCDPAGEKKKYSDYTAMMVVALGMDKNYFLVDAVRDRLNPTERINLLFYLHRKYNDLTGKPPKVGYEKYGMMTDTHYIAERQKNDSYYFPIIELGGSMRKEDRIRRLIPDMQNGRWYFPERLPYVDQEGRAIDLVQELLYSEMKSFPLARYDDMLDALSRIYEPELSMIFPEAKKSMVQKAADDYMNAETGDWYNDF